MARPRATDVRAGTAVPVRQNFDAAILDNFRVNESITIAARIHASSEADSPGGPRADGVDLEDGVESLGEFACCGPAPTVEDPLQLRSRVRMAAVEYGFQVARVCLRGAHPPSGTDDTEITTAPSR